LIFFDTFLDPCLQQARSQKSCKNRKYNPIKKIEFNKYIANVTKKSFCKKLNRFEHYQKKWEM